MDEPVRIYFRVWWQQGGYKHYDTEQEAREAVHPRKGPAVRVDRIEIIHLDPELDD